GEQVARLLRIAVRRQGGEADKIGEEDGDEPSLRDRLRRRRRRRVGGSAPILASSQSGSGRGPKRGRALRAELCAGEVGVTAGRTYRGHPSRAFDAELRSRWILRSAVRADQPCSLTTRRAESTGQPLRYHPE